METGFNDGLRGNWAPMRAMFVIWIALIVSGIAFYMVVGLTHG